MNLDYTPTGLCVGHTIGDILFACPAAVRPDQRMKPCVGKGVIAGVDIDCDCHCHVLPTIDPTAPGAPIPVVDPEPYLPAEYGDRFMRNIPDHGEPMCGGEPPVDLRARIRDTVPDALAFTSCHLAPHDTVQHVGQLITDRTGIWSRIEYTWLDD